MATITTADFAAELGTDAKTARRFLRSDAAQLPETPGKGGRYAIEKRDLRALKSRFAKWTAAQELAKTDRKAGAKAPKAPVVDEVGSETPDHEDEADMEALPY